MKTLIGMIVALLLVAAALIAISDGSLDRYEAERTQRAAITEAERTQRTEIEEAERTQRTAIEQDAHTERTMLIEALRTERARVDAETRMWMASENQATMRLALMMAMIALIAGIAMWGIYLLRKQASDYERRFLLSATPYLDPGWQIVNHRIYGWIVTNGKEYETAQDVMHRMLTMR